MLSHSPNNQQLMAWLQAGVVVPGSFGRLQSTLSMKSSTQWALRAKSPVFKRIPVVSGITQVSLN